MSLSFRQRHRLRCTRRTLSISAPQLASMLVMFARLYAGEDLPAHERARRRMPGRCVRWPVPPGRLSACVAVPCVPSAVPLLGCGRLLRPCGPAGAWLVAHRGTAAVPPAAHRRGR